MMNGRLLFKYTAPGAGPALRLPGPSRPTDDRDGSPSFLTISPRWRCTLPPGNTATTRDYPGSVFFSISSPSSAVTAG